MCNFMQNCSHILSSTVILDFPLQWFAEINISAIWKHELFAKQIPNWVGGFLQRNTWVASRSIHMY